MTSLGISTIEREGFSLTPSAITQGVFIAFRGNADMEAQPLLLPYLKLVHSEALRLKAQWVIMDLHELYFMNSSCFKAFVSWLAEIGSLAPVHRYAVKLISEPNLHWQKRSLDALRRMAPDIVSIVSREEQTT